MTNPLRLLIIGGLSFAVVLTAFFLPRFPQDPQYHRFADQRIFFGIPNFIDVLSNLPFVLTGGLGIWYTARRLLANIDKSPESRWIYLTYLGFFAGVFFTGFGSAYYHLAPDTASLFWDRLPMTVALVSFLCAVIAERVGSRTGLVLLAPLIILGTASVIYWDFSEQLGRGDLRFYVLVQFLPLLLVPLIMLLFPSRYTRGGDLVVALIFYGLSKAGEVLDSRIYALGNIVGGHAIKHLLAALAICWVLRMILKRKCLDEKGRREGFFFNTLINKKSRPNDGRDFLRICLFGNLSYCQVKKPT